MMASLIATLIFYLISLPFRLFRKKSKQEASDSPHVNEGKSASYGSSVIFICMALYGIAGWLIAPYHEGEFWLKSYIFIGFCWGCILYYGLQKGVLQKDDMV